MNVEIKASRKVDKEDPNNINETLFSQPKDGNNVNQLAKIGFYENSEATIAAKDKPTTDENNPKLMSFSYSGDAEYLYIKVINAGSTKKYGFFENLKVTYPALPDVMLENKIISERLNDRNEDPDKASLTLEKSSPAAGTNTGNRYKEGDVVKITAEAGYGYEISAFKAGNNVLKMQKNEDKDEAGNVVATYYIAEYTVGKETCTVTVEYKRKPMSKVRLVTADKSLGNVDFVADDIHDNFYLKGDGFVESYFVAEEPGIMVSTDAKDNYVIDRWTKDSKDGNKVSSSAIYSSTAPAENDSVTYYAHFTLGIEGSVRFRLKDKDGKWLCKLFKDKGADGKNVYDSEALTLDEKSIAPDDQENCRSFFVPKYYTIFKTYDAASIEKGYTLKYWVNKDDISDEYEIGKNYSFTKDKKDITLIPVFEQNPAGMKYRINEPVLTYEFGTASGIRAQRLNIPNGKDFYYSGKVDVQIMENGANLDHTHDAALWINTGKKGFVRNTDLEKWAAIGPGTTLTIASCADTKFEICTYAPISSTTIDGVGIIEVTQPTIDNPQAIIRLLSKGGSLLETYTIDFTLTAPEGKSPKFLYYNVNGIKYSSKEISINDMPPSGYVKMVFDRTMKSISFNMSEICDEMESWTASQGKELTFYYWDLANVKDITVPVKKGAFEYIYGNRYNEVCTTTQDGTELSFLMHFSTRGTSDEISHGTFDFIVGKDGSLEDAINAANANSGTDRYYIFVPDGDYELKGNEPLTN